MITCDFFFLAMIHIDFSLVILCLRSYLKINRMTLCKSGFSLRLLMLSLTCRVSKDCAHTAHTVQAHAASRITLGGVCSTWSAQTRRCVPIRSAFICDLPIVRKGASLYDSEGLTILFLAALCALYNTTYNLRRLLYRVIVSMVCLQCRSRVFYWAKQAITFYTFLHRPLYFLFSYRKCY